MYLERINKVKEYLISNNIDGYIVFLSDDHGSEYIPRHFKGIDYLSNFSGSAGTLLITKNDSFLWTDGRYFLQASQQLKKSNVILKKIGVDETLMEYISLNIKSLSFDFSVASVGFVSQLIKRCPQIILYDKDVLNDIWDNRPKLPTSKINLLSSDLYKNDCRYKCHKTLNYIKTKKNHGVLISALDDIAWVLNCRGKDIKYNPVFVSFLFLSVIDGIEEYTLYINKSKLTLDIMKYFDTMGIKVKPYKQIYKDIRKFDYTIYFDSTKTNYKLYTLMKNKKNKILYPTIFKAIKNNVDIKNSKEAHLHDAIAMCKFLYYLKTNNNEMSELSVTSYLEKLRKKQGAYDLSFSTICGYKEHGAIIHYCSNESTNSQILKEGLLLVDSGGQYKNGTTDITRTIVMGNVSDEMKYHFTLALKSHIDLSMHVFDKNTTDATLDLIARKPLWDNNLDYNHGTGHGVGHILNVHEGPQSIRHNKVNPIKMKKGMITSNEPGLYFENEYGIRHENEVLCIQIDENNLGFEPITYVPFDLLGIDKTLLNDNEINWLNKYHKMVFEKVGKYLTLKERAFLKEATKEI